MELPARAGAAPSRDDVTFNWLHSREQLFTCSNLLFRRGEQEFELRSHWPPENPVFNNVGSFVVHYRKRFVINAQLI